VKIEVSGARRHHSLLSRQGPPSRQIGQGRRRWNRDPPLLGGLAAAVAAVIGRGEPGTDLAGFGGTDGVVAGERLLPVVPGPHQVAVGLVGAGEAAVGAGLLPWRAGLGCEPESGGMVRAGLIDVTGLEENLTKAVAHVSLHDRVADVSKHGQDLLKVPDSLLVAAEARISLAEIGQDL
jgi:hypothetical protein